MKDLTSEAGQDTFRVFGIDNNGGHVDFTPRFTRESEATSFANEVPEGSVAVINTTDNTYTVVRDDRKFFAERMQNATLNLVEKIRNNP